MCCGAVSPFPVLTRAPRTRRDTRGWGAPACLPARLRRGPPAAPAALHLLLPTAWRAVSLSTDRPRASHGLPHCLPAAPAPARARGEDSGHGPRLPDCATRPQRPHLASRRRRRPEVSRDRHFRFRPRDRKGVGPAGGTFVGRVPVHRAGRFRDPLSIGTRCRPAPAESRPGLRDERGAGNRAAGLKPEGRSASAYTQRGDASHGRHRHADTLHTPHIDRPHRTHGAHKHTHAHAWARGDRGHVGAGV